MSRPGTTTIRSETRPSRSARTSTGPWFVAGITGTVDADDDVTKPVTSLAEYARRFGSRASHANPVLFDEAEAYFADRGSEMFVSPTADATDPALTAALALFPRDLGPGQVSAPGRVTATQQVIVADHAAANNRVEILDFADSGDVAALTAASSPAGLSTISARVVGGFGGAWVTIPPAATGGPDRTIPPSGIVAAAMARNDALGVSPNQPSAGDLGVSTIATGVTRAFSDADRTTLNLNGVNLLRSINGLVKIYGYRTLADPVTDENWVLLSNARLFMAIQALCDEVAERFVFRQLDGQRRTISEYGGILTGVILPFWQQGSLYGATPGEAFRVDVGPNVNTDVTIANGELHAIVALRVSPFAEEVILEIVKVKTTEAV